MPIRAMFMQSQSFFGSDSGVHALLMRNFDRSDVEVHVARTTEDSPNPAVSTIRRIAEIPDVYVRPTHFGPSVTGLRWRARVAQSLQAPLVPLSLGSLAGYVRRNRIQIIHGTEKPRDAFYGVLLGKLTGASSIIHMHVGYGEWQRATVKWALRHADGIIGVSRFVADTIVRAGIPAERVHAVVNALDLAGWEPIVDGRTKLHALGVPHGAPVVGISSRLYHWKGHHHLINAIAEVKRAIPDVRLVIVGEDDSRAHPGGGSYRAELEQQTRQLNLQDTVIFTGFRTDVRDLLAGFDLYAMPTWEEPCAIAFLEAMAMEKAVVAWRSGGTPEMVVHNETGLLVEPHSTSALAHAITELLKDPERRNRLGKAGRKRVEQVLNPKRMCSEVVAVYRSTLAVPKMATLRHGSMAVGS
jgi:glycosyltransferase involved in cell wall biosynthesis